MLHKSTRLTVLVLALMLVLMLALPLSASAAAINITNVYSVSVTTVGTTVTWTPVTTGGSGSYEYRYVLRQGSTTGTAVAVTGWTASSTYSYSFTETGTYYLTVIARDAASPADMSPQFTAPSVTVIGTGPVIGSVTASNYVVSTNTGVNWTVYNVNGGVGVTGADGPVTYTYELVKDGSLLNSFVRSTYSFNYVLTAPGNYVLRVMATDKNGSSAWVSAGVVTVVSAPPVISAVHASATVVQQGSKVTFTATVTGGYGAKTYYWALYHAGSVVESATTTTPSWTPTLNLTGAYMCQCEAVDSTGAKSGPMNSTNVVVEVPATFEIKSIKPTKAQVGINTSATWKVTIGGGIGKKTVRYVVYKDGMAYATSSGTTTGDTYTITHWVSDTGVFTVEAYAEDENGNVTVTFVSPDSMLAIDPTSLTITSLTVSVNKIANPTTVTWNWKIENNQGGVRTYYKLIRNGTTAVYSGYTTGRVFQWKISAYGIYTLEIYAVDVVTGKETPRVTGGEVTYGATGPVTITSPTAVKDTYVAPANIQWVWNVTNTVGTVRTYYQVNKNGAAYSVASTTSSNLNLFVDEPGTYVIQVQAKDGSGRMSTVAYGDPITVTAAPSGVTVNSITASPTTVKVGDPVTWTYTVKNGVGTVTGYWAVFDGSHGQVDAGSCAPGNYSFSYTPMTPGTYTVQVQVVDSNGVSKMVEGGKVTVTPVPGGSLTVTAPTPNTTSATTGSPVTWNFSVSGASGDYRVYYLIKRNGSFYKTSGVTNATSITWPMTEDGTYDIQIEAVDGTTAERSGVAYGTATVTVTGGVTPPGTFTMAIPQPTAATINVGGNAVWTLKFSNAEGNVHTYYDVLLDGAVQTHNATYGASISYPATVPGIYTLRLEAIDEATGNSSGTVYSASVTVKAIGGKGVEIEEPAETPAPAAPETEAPKTEEPAAVEPAAEEPVVEFSAAAKPTKGTAPVGSTLVWKLSSTGATGTVTFNCEILRNGEVVATRTSGEGSITYQASELGSYTLRYEATDNGSGATTGVKYANTIKVIAD